MRQVIVFPGEDGYWVAECPSLPGCISQDVPSPAETGPSRICEVVALFGPHLM